MSLGELYDRASTGLEYYPDFDLLIASIALANQHILVTRLPPLK
jgi:predicted nucleic acid-binding protein